MMIWFVHIGAVARAQSQNVATRDESRKKNEIMSNQQLTDELNKPIFRELI